MLERDDYLSVQLNGPLSRESIDPQVVSEQAEDLNQSVELRLDGVGFSACGSSFKVRFNWRNFPATTAVVEGAPPSRLMAERCSDGD